MNNLSAALAFITIASLGAVAAHADAKGALVEHVSFVQLAGNPEKYNGKVVVVSGWVTDGYENSTLCKVSNPTQVRDCVWIAIYSRPMKTKLDADLNDAAMLRWRKNSGKKMTVRGKFDMHDTGHLNCCAGTLNDVEEVEAKKGKGK